MLDNIIEKYGLDEVSKRTKIAKHNLEKLLKKEFSSFSKPRALGFVSILEREYKEDLSAFKEEIHKWFEDNSKDDKRGNNITFPPLESKKKSRHWIATVPIIIVLIFGFYLYRNEFSNTELANESIIVNNIQTVTDEKRDETTIKKLKSEESEENTSVKLSSVQSKDTSKVEAIDKNLSTSTEKEIKSKSIIKKSETNKTTISSISPYVPTENVVIYPNRKMWIGVINLKTKKRSSRMISKAYTIELDAERLIITGHGFFSVSDAAGNNLKFHGSKKHYFLLKEGVMKEIDSKEFKRLNGGRIW